MVDFHQRKNSNQIIYQLLTIGHPYLAIVFANTKQRVDEITDYLKDQGLKVAKIHGDITPRERKRVMRQVQNLDYQYVVATDLAARGIDIEGFHMSSMQKFHMNWTSLSIGLAAQDVMD